MTSAKSLGRHVKLYEPRFFKLSEWENPRWDPYPEKWLESRWMPLAQHCDVIRKAWGAPLYVTPNGGYRSPEHNASLGNRPTSQHVQGRAVDLRPNQRSSSTSLAWESDIRKLWRLIWQLWRDDKLPGLSGVGRYPTFVHIDVGGPMSRGGGPRRWVAKKDSP